MRVAPVITLSDADRQELQRWAKGRSVQVRQMLRAKIVLAAADGKDNQTIAAELQTNRLLVGQWRKRFAEQGLAGIAKDASGRGRKPVVRDSLVQKIVETTTRGKPDNATHWSTRSLANFLDTTQSMIHRVWRANNLKPHLVRPFKLSNDPQFIEKVVDVVGLYMNPPEHALVLSCDEKSQIQALDRTQPGLPLKKGRCGTMTHDYKRNGTTTLFAALEMAQGKLIGTCMPRHRHQEWIKFLELIDAQTPPALDLHLIVDNYNTHKHEKVRRWLKHHPRFHMHFIPTSSSWLNLIERWFREITDKRIRRGAFSSVSELIEEIMTYIAKHNENPRSFTWTAKAGTILKKIRRVRKVLNKIASI
jgi:transposase